MILSKHRLKEAGCYDKEWIIDNMQYEVLTGSHAYGCQNDESDFDIYGFCIPPKEFIFPELAGLIHGFSTNMPKFDQLIVNKFPYKKSTAEGQIFNIVKYFKLCMGNNPNMIDTMFVRPQNRTHYSKIAKMVVENRSMFISKKCWHTFKGYAYSQLHKIRTKRPEGKRVETVNKYGYDVKFAAHVVRLLYEVEQLLEHGEMDLMLHKEELKSVRRGDWKISKVESFFENKVSHLEELYHKTSLPYAVDEEKIRILLFNCLEEHFGDLKTEGIKWI